MAAEDEPRGHRQCLNLLEDELEVTLCTVTRVKEALFDNNPIRGENVVLLPVAAVHGQIPFGA